MKNSFLTVLILCFGLIHSFSFGQGTTKAKISDWKAVSSAFHQQGKWLIGAGPTLIGVTAKAGRFIANRTWLGIEAESHSLLSYRQEAGVFARYYLWNGSFISGFSEIGVSYGHFQGWNWDFDKIEPPQPLYRSAKLNAAFGLECPIGRRLSLEGVAKFGRLTQVNWIQPSVQGSINLYLGR